jgi:RNA polymerase sigma-70 factor (sigma-E family)
MTTMELTMAELDADTALTQLFRAHYGSLLRLAVVLADDHATAEDLVQDAYVRMHRSWGRLRDPDKALAYLRACVANGSHSRLRRLRTARRHVEPAHPNAPSAEQVAAEHQEHADVYSALGRLSQRQREVLVLRYYGELSEAEIAAALGISTGAVKSHAHRGIAALEQAMEAAR